MISISKAERIILENCPHPTQSQKNLLESYGFALAEDVIATEDVPPFNRAMMDGFALISEDTENYPVILDIIGEVAAGQFFNGEVNTGKAVRIMTGSPVPEGANAVQKFEVCEELPQKRAKILEPLNKWKNVAKKGSEFQKGSIVLKKGNEIRPPQMGILAMFGKTKVKVYDKPVSCLINTGSELLEISEKLTPGKIRNSNLYSILPLFQKFGFHCDPKGIVKDDLDSIRNAIRNALDYNVILLTGGVSMGDYDLVERAAHLEGFKILINKIAIKPGKPMIFASRGNNILFGLSGNPVSSMVQSIRFVLPFLLKYSGFANYNTPLKHATLTSNVKHRGDRSSYLPGYVFEKAGYLFCEPQFYKGSADLFAYRKANCIYLIPDGIKQISKGESIQVIMLPW